MIESLLTRKYDITFIDARYIAKEAQANLEITGYPTEEQKQLILSEASRMFEEQYSDEIRSCMAVRRNNLDCAKSDCSDSVAGSDLDDMSQHTSDSSEPTRRRISIFGRRL